jgi:hypothetical protein
MGVSCFNRGNTRCVTWASLTRKISNLARCGSGEVYNSPRNARPQEHRRHERIEVLLLIERRTGVVYGEHALQHGILFLDRSQRIVDDLADSRLLGIVLQIRPARFLRNPEYIFGGVFISIFGDFLARLGFFDVVFALRISGFLQEMSVLLFKSIGDVLEENQTEDDVFVFGGIHVAAQLIGSRP